MRRKTTHWNPSPAARAQPGCGWQSARLAWELAGSAAASQPQDPCHFLWQQTENQQNNHMRHLQLSAKSHNTECGKLAKLFPSFHETGTSSDWSADVWMLWNSCSAPEWRCSHTTPKSRESLCRDCHHCLLSSFPSCCSSRLCSCRGGLYYGVTSVYFCTPFNTVVGPPSFFWDENSTVCAIGSVPAVCAKPMSFPYVQHSVLPIQKGQREKKGEVEQGKGIINPWMFWEHRNMHAFTGAQCYMRKKPTHSSVKGCGKANHLLQCTHNSETAELCK